ncbi:MAG TPA: MFS transporter [Candidatus Polarisedimenticolaceae bacterium]|nr:MFS transporter [Candidatus Polarisedimenticolaceae bacterium]
MSPLRRVGQAYRAAFAGLSRDAWLFSLVTLVNRAGGMVLPFLVLYLTQRRGLSVPEAGRVLSLYGLGSIGGSYVGGWLVDRFGPVRTQQVSLIGGGVGLLLLGWARGPLPIALCACATSFVGDMFRPAVMAALSRGSSPEQQARAFTLLRLAVNLGLGVGPAVGGFLALRSYGWLFACDAATCLAAAGVLFACYGWSEPPQHPRLAAEADSARSPWRDGPFLVLLLLVLLLTVVFFQLVSTLTLYLHQRYGLAEDAIGLVLALNAGLIVAFEMVLIHRLERREPLFLIGFGSALVCLGFGLLPFGRSTLWVVATTAIWTAGEMLALPLLNAVVAARAGGRHRGRYLGAYTVAFSTALAVAPIAGTTLYAWIGAERFWYALGALGPLLWIAFAALAPAFRRAQAN